MASCESRSGLYGGSKVIWTVTLLIGGRVLTACLMLAGRSSAAGQFGVVRVMRMCRFFVAACQSML